MNFEELHSTTQDTPNDDSDKHLFLDTSVPSFRSCSDATSAIISQRRTSPGKVKKNCHKNYAHLAYVCTSTAHKILVTLTSHLWHCGICEQVKQSLPPAVDQLLPISSPSFPNPYPLLLLRGHHA